MCRALLFGSGVAALGAVHAQEQPKQSTAAPAVDEVIVTGSIIKRSDFETPSPVQVLSSEDITQSGYTSVTQVLSSLSANGQGTLSNAFPGAFAGGASGIALRGLTVGETLTLVDGERMVAYPLSDDGQRSFVDTNSLPLLAVDHIDVLKDGASAAYGSDAIAGVVNVVLKKTFTGFQASAEGGTTSHGDGTNQRFTAIGGIGDLTANGYNAYVAVEYRHADPIAAFSRGGAFTQQNWAPEGGANATLGAGSPGFYGFPAGAGPYLVPEGLSGSTFAALPTSSFLHPSQCANAAAVAADQCAYLQTGSQIQPETGNLNILARLTVNLGGDWQAKVTGSFFQSNGEQVVGPTQIGGGPSATAFPPGSPIQFPLYYPGFVGVTSPQTLVVPASNPMNTSGVPEYPVATLFEAGQPTSQYSTDTYRVYTEFTGPLGGWDIDLNLGEMYALTTETFLGAVNVGALQNALNNGYVFGTGGAAFAGVDPPFSSDFSDSLQVVDLRGSRALFSLPGGPVELALGGGYYHRFLDATQSQAAINSDSSANLAYAIGGQTDYNAYGEVNAPLLKNLELDVSGRYDHYNEGGSAAVPKLGLKWTPLPQLTLRGTYSEGYRAPNPAENGSAAEAFLFANSADPILCPSSLKAGPPDASNHTPVVTPAKGDVAQYCNFLPVFVQTTNPNLKPETSKSFTGGFVFKPVNQVSLSVDYWRTQLNNIILTDSLFGALPFPAAPMNNMRSGPVTLPVLDGNGGTTSTLFPQGVPIDSLSAYENAGQILVDGLDVDLLAHFDIGQLGKITTSLNYSHIFEYDVSSCANGQCGSVELAGTHGPSGIGGDTGNPQDRAVLTVSWDRGPLDVTATINYVGHYSLNDPSIGETTCADAVADYGGIKFGLTGVYPTQYCEVRHFTDVNLYASYMVNEHLTVFGSVDNLFNSPPPVDIGTYGAGPLAYNPSMAQAGAVGALFDVGFQYKY